MHTHMYVYTYFFIHLWLTCSNKGNLKTLAIHNVGGYNEPN